MQKAELRKAEFTVFKDDDLKMSDLESEVKVAKIIPTLHFATMIQYIKLS